MARKTSKTSRRRTGKPAKAAKAAKAGEAGEAGEPAKPARAVKPRKRGKSGKSGGPQEKPSEGGLRITAGELRGRNLYAPPGKVLRPMRSQVRAALFNVLGAEVEGAVVLDLFSGSGCLGLEALSRGAERVVFVERERVCLEAIRRNVEDLGQGERVEVRRHDLNLGLGSLSSSGPYDLVLVHPPFELLGRGTPSQGLDVAALLSSIPTTPGLLAPQGSVAFETPRGCYPQVESELPTLEVWRRRDYGTTTLFLAEARAEADGAAASAQADGAAASALADGAAASALADGAAASALADEERGAE